MQKYITDLDAATARQQLLLAESYCTLDLPPYFDFSRVLQDCNDALTTDIALPCPAARNHDDVNYTIVNNKDGRYAWRPISLMHPVLYVDLVRRITEPDHWATICVRFAQFRQDTRIQCLSIPIAKPSSDEKTKAAQITHWWVEVEQRSFDLALDYSLVVHTDLTDCYGSIYTHAIAWSLHGKDEAKRKRRCTTLVGNVIDTRLQDSRHGQTNGIPQGSTLMDFIAEMVLGYADTLLTQRLGPNNKDFLILRYRDDYRIFTNNSTTGELVLKYLSDVTQELGLKLNPNKTRFSDNVVQGAIKADKLSWITSRQYDPNLQKQFLILHNHALHHPNGGSLHVALLEAYERVARLEEQSDNAYTPQLGIVLDIAMKNPRSFPICAAIMSRLLGLVSSPDKRTEMLRKIAAKLGALPNTGYLQVWLQRISIPHDPAITYSEPLCSLVAGAAGAVWNNDWLPSDDLKRAADPTKLIDTGKRDAINKTIEPHEVELFSDTHDS